jgi:hypothetical protein
LIVSERRFGRSNRIRVVAQAREATFYSQEFRLHVGLTVLAVVFENQVKIAAVVDNSLVQRYNFEARLVVPTRSNGFDYLTLRVATRQPALGTARATDDGWRLEKCSRGNARTPVYRLRITRSPSPGPLVGKWLLRHRNRVKFRILVHQNRIGL